MFGPTVQGEGAVIGQHTYFLRFGLCDYKCLMCDSMHAVDPTLVKHNAEWLTQQEIFDRFIAFADRDKGQSGVKWVTFSGGNPCIHDLSILVVALKVRGFKIAVETQGTKYQRWLWDCDIVTVSPKAPGIGERFERSVFRKFMEQLHSMRGLNVKVVVFDTPDLAFVVRLIEDTPWIQRNQNSFYLSQGNPHPRDNLDAEHMSNVLRMEYLRLLATIQGNPILSQVKFLPQWHVWLYGNQKGV